MRTRSVPQSPAHVHPSSACVPLRVKITRGCPTVFTVHRPKKNETNDATHGFVSRKVKTRALPSIHRATRHAREKTVMENHRVHVLRLKPGEDLKLSLHAYCEHHALTSAWIITCVGSLQSAHLRLANHTSLLGLGSSTNSVLKLPDQKFEVVSLTGTVSAAGASSHLHCALADRHGDCVGGHVLEGCTVFTTCEIVLGSCGGWKFAREHDEETGFDELVAYGEGGTAKAEEDVLKGKKARRARQMAAIEEDRARREEMGEFPVETRGILGFFVKLVAPPPERATPRDS